MSNPTLVVFRSRTAVGKLPIERMNIAIRYNLNDFENVKNVFQEKTFLPFGDLAMTTSFTKNIVACHGCYDDRINQQRD